MAEGRDERFVEWLGTLFNTDDRATMAALRKGLGKEPGTAMEMLPHVTRFLGTDESRWSEECLHMIASLFAFHPCYGGGDSIGTVLRSVRDRTESGSVERRFVALLNAHPEDIANHLRHVVSLVKSKDIPIDWLRLLQDLRHWRHPSRYVQRRWARDFWGIYHKDEEGA